MYQLILLLCVTAFVGVSMLFAKRLPDKADTYLKVIAVIFCLIGIFRYPLADGIMLLKDGEDIPQCLLRWCYHIGYAILPMSAFTSRRLFRNIATCFSLPISLIAVVFYDSTFSYFLIRNDTTYLLSAPYRHVFYIAELTLAVSLPLLLLAVKGHRPNARNISELKDMLLAIPASLYMMMPAWMPEALFGSHSEITPEPFSLFHISWIVYLILAPIIITGVFKNKDESAKHHLCIYVAIAQVFHTMSIFLKGFTLHRMPLQLCCIAAFFYLYTMITRNRKFFDFCFVSNMVGAFIAVALMSFNSDTLSFWNIHYMQEHSFVIILPIVALSLGLFPRIDRAAVKPIAQIFVCYFLFCLVAGTAINIIANDPGYYTVNYFYMFDLECALDYVPFAGFAGLIAIDLGATTLYPLLIVVIFVVFLALCYAFYFLMQGIYAVNDRIRAYFRKSPRKNDERILACKR